MSLFVTVKAHLNGNVRKFKMEKNKMSYSVLCEKINCLFGIGEDYSLRLKYKDMDGDMVCFSTDEELDVGLEECGLHRNFNVYVEEFLNYDGYDD